MEIKRFVCRVCNQYFFEESKLKQHSLVHFSPISYTNNSELLESENRQRQHQSDYVTPTVNLRSGNSQSRFRTPEPNTPTSIHRGRTKFERITLQVERNSQYFVASATESKTNVAPSRPKQPPKSRTSQKSPIGNGSTESKISEKLNTKGKLKAKDINKYSCKWCDKQFPFHCRYREHLKANHSDKMNNIYKEYPCNDCGLRFPNSSFANVHMEHYHPKQQPKKSISKSQIIQPKVPLKKKNPKILPPIKECLAKRSVFSGGQIENPVIIGTPIGTPNYPFKCTLCPFGHYSKGLVEKHERLHLICQLCKYQAKHIVFYMYHLRRHHNLTTIENDTDTKTKDTITCPICTKEFGSKETYARISRHLQNHTGLTFTCKICEQKYRRKELLSKHYKHAHKC